MRFHLRVSTAKMKCYCRAIVCEELAQGPYTVTVSDEARTHVTHTLHVTGRVIQRFTHATHDLLNLLLSLQVCV